MKRIYKVTQKMPIKQQNKIFETFNKKSLLERITLTGHEYSNGIRNFSSKYIKALYSAMKHTYKVTKKIT